jgi:hypothetical protein
VQDMVRGIGCRESRRCVVHACGPACDELRERRLRVAVTHRGSSCYDYPLEFPIGTARYLVFDSVETGWPRTVWIGHTSLVGFGDGPTAVQATA